MQQLPQTSTIAQSKPSDVSRRNTLLLSARQKRRWKQQQLADFATVSLATVKRAERGEPISLYSIDQFCTCLQKTPEQLGFFEQEDQDQTTQAHHLVISSETKHVGMGELSFFLHLVNQLSKGEMKTLAFWSLAGRHCPHLLEAASCQFQDGWNEILFTHSI